MALKDAFTDEEWHAVIRAPMVASFAITAADPGGLWGAVREAGAAAGALRAARDEGDLPAEIVAAYETSEGRSIAREGVTQLARGKSPAEGTEAAIAELGRIAGIVDAKIPAEAPHFKDWLREIARKVAEAGTEGGFLGFGGVKVSDAEKMALADIDAALDDDAPLDGGPIPV